jgi:hypothetical protein
MGNRKLTDDELRDLARTWFAEVRQDGQTGERSNVATLALKKGLRTYGSFFSGSWSGGSDCSDDGGGGCGD